MWDSELGRMSITLCIKIEILISSKVISAGEFGEVDTIVQSNQLERVTYYNYILPAGESSTRLFKKYVESVWLLLPLKYGWYPEKSR